MIWYRAIAKQKLSEVFPINEGERVNVRINGDKTITVKYIFHQVVLENLGEGYLDILRGDVGMVECDMGLSNSLENNYQRILKVKK